MKPILLALALSAAEAAETGDILKTHCLDCHSTKKQKGELDLETSDIHKEPHIWENVLDQIELGEMPPKKEKQLTAEEKKQLVGWVRGTLDQIALANAGDPGPVVLRRLSNMEYTYTLRDLTGIESLDPAREFPVDGAAGEGFTNAGAALVMSPALLTKYLDAAKDIASHAVFTPHGLRWSASTSAQDWTEETLARIRAIYSKHTTTAEGTQTVAQGIKLDTGTGGGRLPLTPYLDALQGRRSSDGLSLKYLQILRQALTSTQPSILLDPLRVKFREKKLSAADIEPWQQVLWRFANVGHIGKENGPKAWQEPVTPIGSQHELRVKLTPQHQKLYLVATDAGDGSETDAAIWQNARLVAKGHPDVKLLDLATTKTPQVIEVDVPAANIVKDAEFIVTAKHSSGSVQVQVLTEAPQTLAGLQPGHAAALTAEGKWSDNNLRTAHSAPLLIADNSETRKRFVAAFDGFRALFPIALSYSRIVPVDEVVTLTLFYREDEALQRLMLSEAESRELDHLWGELLFISEAPLKQVDAFEQLWQFATQDAKPSAFEPMREPILKAAANFKQQQKAAIEPQKTAVLAFAEKAWRRPLTKQEIAGLRTFDPHLMLVRVLTSPAFLYRGEKAPDKTGPVNQQELATRLSYFLWASAPDDELRSAKLEDIPAQARRMLKSDKVRRLATEFGCQWLHVRDVATLDEKSERHFPTFLDLRDDMQEEVTRFFIDLIQNNRSILSLLDADHTFVNAELAKHYGIIFPADSENPQIQNSDKQSVGFLNLREINAWTRINGLHAQGRGGILGFAATLAKQAGASRNSAILRGTWLTEVVLGEKLPIPPKGVPVLPEEAPANLTERQLIERHSRDENCMGCHKRIDPFGFALEGFDAIGRARQADTKTTLPDGTSVDGLSDLRDYLLTKRRHDFTRQFCRKLLGYALGRSVLLSDKPMIEQMMKSDLRFVTLVEHIVSSKPFREIRGR